MDINSIINKLKLQPHPEGGFYSETYRSDITIPGKDRQLMTSIYFLLSSENVSRFHRIKSDELWFYHSGSPLVVHRLENGSHSQTLVGPNILEDELPYFLVPKDTIFGSTVLNKNSYSLVSCVVSPGFDFKDFELFSEEQLIVDFPDHQDIIEKLT
jgi:predicted cupin superfamily sugar epimerase